MVRQPLFLLASLFLWGGTIPSPAISVVDGGFIENRGQVNSSVLYYVPGSGVTTYLTKEAVVLDLHGPALVDRMDEGLPRAIEDRGRRGTMAEGETEAPPSQGCAVWVFFEGANPSPGIEAIGELPSRHNFFLGNDPERWRTDVPAFEEVVYRDLWPGVDLIWRIEASALHFEVISSPGASAASVRFRYEGAEEVAERPDGSVLIETPLGRLLCTRPDPTFDNGRFLRIPSGGNDGIRYGLADNPDALTWSTFLGGSSDEWGVNIDLDSSGNIVVLGYTTSADFPTTPGAYDESHNGMKDLYVAKLDGTGSSLIWSTIIGGGDEDWGSHLLLDASGNPIVTGETKSADYPTTPGAFDESYHAAYDAFVTKLDASGSSLVWSTFLAGGDEDWCRAFSLDATGSPVLIGLTRSSDFPTTPGAYDESHNGDMDVFVAKLDATGSDLLWSTFVGGSAWDAGWVLSQDPSGNLVVSGYTFSSDFPTTPGAYDESFNGTEDVFVANLNASGSSLLWSTFVGGNGQDEALGLVLDASGNPIVAGNSYSSDYPTTPGAYDESHNGFLTDVIVSKLDASGSNLLWSTFLGGTFWDYAYSIDLDPSGNPVLVGYTNSSGFPTTPWAYDLSYDAAWDGFVSKLDASGSYLLWSSYLGGSSDDYPQDLLFDPSGALLMVGFTSSTGFPTTPGVYNETHNGGADGFVANLDISGIVSVTAEPDTTHFPSGGLLGFEVCVTNHADSTVNFQAWTEVATPWGSTFSPLLGPANVTLGPLETYCRHIDQQVTERAPLGGPYVYRVSAGTFPEGVMAVDTFEFFITP